MTRRWMALAGAVVAAFAFAPAGRVAAHAALESSTPSANSVLESMPERIELDFDEGVETAQSSIRLFDSAGAVLDVGPPAAGADASQIVVPVLGSSAGNGLYAVIWRVVSADGHVVDGSFAFQVGTGSPGTTGDAAALIDKVATDGDADHALTVLAALARGVGYVALVLVAGTGLWALQSGGIGRRRGRRLVRLGAVLAVVGAVVQFTVQAARVAGGGPGDLLDIGAWGDVVHTDSGRALSWRVGAAVVLACCAVLSRWNRRRWWQFVAVVATAIALVSYPLSGHANAQQPRWWWVAIDALHLLSVVVWLGGLVLLVALGRDGRSADGAAVTRRFSTSAGLLVAAGVATGVAQTVRLAGGFDDVTATVWGRVLLVKVTLVVAALGVAGVSRWLLRQGDGGAIGRPVAIELLCGVSVLALAAVLVAQPPRPATPTSLFGQTLAGSGVLANVTITPGGVGINEVHIIVTPPGGSLTPVVGVTARVSLPEASVPNAPVTLSAVGPNHYQGSIAFPSPGAWQLDVIVQVTATDTALLSAQVAIPGG